MQSLAKLPDNVSSRNGDDLHRLQNVVTVCNSNKTLADLLKKRLSVKEVISLSCIGHVHGTVVEFVMGLGRTECARHFAELVRLPGSCTEFQRLSDLSGKMLRDNPRTSVRECHQMFSNVGLASQTVDQQENTIG